MVSIFFVTKVFCLGSIYYDQVQSRVHQKVTLDPSVTLINGNKITHMVISSKRVICLNEQLFLKLSHEMLSHAMVRDKPGGLSLQPPPSPGKWAAQFKSPFGDSCLQVFEDVLHMFYLETKRKFPENLCFSGTNQKPERRRPFRTGLVRHCPQGLFSPFFTFLRALFFGRLDFSSPPLSAPGSPRMGIRLLTTSGRLYFRRSPGPPQEEKERGLIYRTAVSNRAEICFCM